MAIIYFAAAVAGIVMGASGDHTLMAVHAHLNLLGWVSMTLFALIGMAHPAITEGPLATAQFWLHNIGVPVMLGALVLRLKGYTAVEPVIGLALRLAAHEDQPRTVGRRTPASPARWSACAESAPRAQRNRCLACWRVDDSSPLRVWHAQRGSEEECIEFSNLLQRMAPYFEQDNGGHMIDQAWQPRLVDGMVRAYLVGDRVTGFGHQAINALYPAPSDAAPPTPGPWLYYPADLPLLRPKAHARESVDRPAPSTRGLTWEQLRRGAAHASPSLRGANAQASALSGHSSSACSLGAFPPADAAGRPLLPPGADDSTGRPAQPGIGLCP